MAAIRPKPRHLAHSPSTSFGGPEEGGGDYSIADVDVLPTLLGERERERSPHVWGWKESGFHDHRMSKESIRALRPS
ncbi:hypothetical protein Tco_1485537 [Tanacetum coccineum]